MFLKHIKPLHQTSHEKNSTCTLVHMLTLLGFICYKQFNYLVHIISNSSKKHFQTILGHFIWYKKPKYKENCVLSIKNKESLCTQVQCGAFNLARFEENSMIQPHVQLLSAQLIW